MSKKQRNIRLAAAVVILILLLVGCILTGSVQHPSEPIKELMKDAVLHDANKISLFGLTEVNPGLIAAFTVTGLTLIFCVIVRIFVIPKFKETPHGFQLVLEEAVGFFSNLAKTNSHRFNRFLGSYLFSVGFYVFFGTLFELLGLQVITTKGLSVAMPAPISDINGAIAVGCLSYSIILFGGLFNSGAKGFFTALKDFSLPISMSFRLFGALLSGALVTELVYHYIHLSFVLPVFVAVMFTLLHAVIQTYVLTMLTAMFYGEASEHEKKKKKTKKQKI